MNRRGRCRGGFLFDASRFDRPSVTVEVLKEKNSEADKTVKITLSNDKDLLQATIAKRKVTASNGIAFDHAGMIQYAVERLRNKVEYTDIAFELMPELFTLSELQQVYEVILGKELLSAAFRRKIAGMVTETDHFAKNAGHGLPSCSGSIRWRFT